MANRTRKIPLQFYVNAKERGIIGQRMEQIQSKTLSEYLRKSAVFGVEINQNKEVKNQCKNC